MEVKKAESRSQNQEGRIKEPESRSQERGKIRNSPRSNVQGIKAPGWILDSGFCI
jgi:hypothetical protein